MEQAQEAAMRSLVGLVTATLLSTSEHSTPLTKATSLGYQSQQTLSYWAGHLLSPTNKHGAHLPQPTKHLDVCLGEPLGPDAPSARNIVVRGKVIWERRGEKKQGQLLQPQAELRLLQKWWASMRRPGLLA